MSPIEGKVLDVNLLVDIIRDVDTSDGDMRGSYLLEVLCNAARYGLTLPDEEQSKFVSSLFEGVES